YFLPFLQKGGDRPTDFLKKSGSIVRENYQGEENMSKKVLYSLTTLLIVAMMVLSACGTPAPATQEPAAEQPGADVTGKVGIVLPTKDEPRWIQDETRFREALQEAGYDVEILF